MRRILSNKELLELHSGKYVKNYSKENSKKRMKRLLPLMNLNKHDIVADFGCGSSVLLSLIYNKVRYYYGLDFNPEFILIANELLKLKHIKNAEFHCADIVKFCEREEYNSQFNKVFALDLSEHIYDETFKNIALSAYKILKPRGRFYLHTPNLRFILEILKKYGILKQFLEHVAVRDAKQYKELLSMAGFNEIKVKYLPHWHPILRYFHIFSCFPLIGDLFKARLWIECIK